MLKKLASLKEHIKQTDDSEPEQALVRVFISLLLIAIFCLSWHPEEKFYEIQISTVNLVILDYFIFAVAIVIAHIKKPQSKPN